MFKRVGGRLYLSLHCTMQDDLPLSRVHDIQTAMEGRFGGNSRAFPCAHPSRATDRQPQVKGCPKQSEQLAQIATQYLA